jgi:hypothetical protein
LPYVSTTHQSGSQSRTQDEFEDGQERSLDDKLVWVDALNKWVPENQVFCQKVDMVYKIFE